MQNLTEKEKIKLIIMIECRLAEVKDGLERLEREKSNYHNVNLDKEYEYSFDYLNEENKILTEILRKFKEDIRI